MLYRLYKYFFPPPPVENQEEEEEEARDRRRNTRRFDFVTLFVPAVSVLIVDIVNKKLKAALFIELDKTMRRWSAITLSLVLTAVFLVVFERLEPPRYQTTRQRLKLALSGLLLVGLGWMSLVQKHEPDFWTDV